MTDTTATATYTLTAEDRAAIDTPCQATVIASQTYLSKDIVYAKSDAQDYQVLVSQPIQINGQMYRLVNDGHHRLAAAVLDGVPVDWTEDRIITHDGDTDRVLAECNIDAPWYDVTTGEPIAW